METRENYQKADEMAAKRFERVGLVSYKPAARSSLRTKKQKK